MKKIFYTFLIIILLATKISNATEIKLYTDYSGRLFDTIPSMIADEYFISSLHELSEMIDEKKPYSLKRAEFLVENAYYNGKMNYSKFCNDINNIVQVLNKFILKKGIQKYKTAPNFAIYEYFTKSSPLNGNKKFLYDPNDPFGQNDFSSFFTTKLMRTHSGQCSSLSIYYKILCDELGGESFLALGPSHMYIKHIGEDGRWVNIELTNGSFVRDVWLIETMNISTEAIRSGIYLTAFSKKETIAYMIHLLALAYHQKYQSYDEFVNQCINIVLERLPNFTPIISLKLYYHQYQGLSYIEKYGQIRSGFGDYHYDQYKSAIERLDSLGYSDHTPEEYNEMVNSER